MSEKQGKTNANQGDWRPIGKYAIQRKPYTIAKYFLPNPVYALWKDGVDKAIGYFDNAEDAKRKADE